MLSGAVPQELEPEGRTPGVEGGATHGVASLLAGSLQVTAAKGHFRLPHG